MTMAKPQDSLIAGVKYLISPDQWLVTVWNQDGEEVWEGKFPAHMPSEAAKAIAIRKAERSAE